jgi:large subunit ribosomal protein L16
MLQPKRTKFRKQQKGRMKGNSGRGHLLSNGTFGIKSLDSCFITARQIEAARIAATRYMKREGSFGLRYFQTSRLPKNLLKYVWVKVKVPLNIGQLL